MLNAIQVSRIADVLISRLIAVAFFVVNSSLLIMILYPNKGLILVVLVEAF